ncbi:hypothetical protein [Alloactinosynnema sp. L-07]|nr:hypothetical protein [Alloactinosynnema sp. L-07]
MLLLDRDLGLSHRGFRHAALPGCSNTGRARLRALGRG